MLALVALCVGHVPTYAGGSENCFTPPHSHTTSQVIYLKSSGGIELHITSPTSPFDIPGGEILDVDAVFKKKYDQSTYSLFIGCGGCVASQDPIVIPPVYLSGYEHGEVEPFTQVRTSRRYLPSDHSHARIHARRLYTTVSSPRRTASSTRASWTAAAKITLPSDLSTITIVPAANRWYGARSSGSARRLPLLSS